jgi:serine/threonine protein kinase
VTRVVPRAGDVVRGQSSREYRLMAWHAEGSYSRVFRAEAVQAPSMSCAIKLAKLEVPCAAERLTQEGEIRGRFRHPRVPELLDTGSAGEAPFLALAWVEGTTLRALVERQRRLPLVTALAVLRDVAAVAAEMHREGLAHGDLRADNVLVTQGRDGARAMVADLGAVATREGLGRAGEGEFDAAAAADTRQLGRLLHFMLTGGPASQEGAKLSSSHGHHPGVVAISEAASGGSGSALTILRDVEALIRGLSRG